MHYFSGHTGDPPAITPSSRQCLCSIISFLPLSFPSSNKSRSFLKLHVQQLDRWLLNTSLLIMEVKEGILKPVNACFSCCVFLLFVLACSAPADYCCLPVPTAWYFSGGSEMSSSPFWSSSSEGAAAARAHPDSSSSSKLHGLSSLDPGQGWFCWDRGVEEERAGKEQLNNSSSWHWM